jgi:hypothetical protein
MSIAPIGRNPKSEMSPAKKFSILDGIPRDESNVNDTTQGQLGAEYLFLILEKHWMVPV